MRRLLRLSVVSVVSAIALLAGGSTVAAASPVGDVAIPAVDDVVSSLAATTGAEEAGTLRYWTAERMAQATPLGPVLAAPAEPAESTEAARRGEPTLVPPTRATAAEPQAESSTGEPWTGGGEVTRTVGRVFFTIDGEEAYCSGNAVTSENKSVVVTAGHCVRYQGEWAENWIFVPGYEEGDRPYGAWTARELLTTEQWARSQDVDFDVGMAVVNTRDGRHLTEVIGGQGIAFNQPRGQLMYAFGYPVGGKYDGQRLIYCSGKAFDDQLGTNDLGLSCDMSGGTSGGPWFIDFDESSGAGVQNSVSSFKYALLPNSLFGPYFGESVQDLYQRAQTT